MMSDQLQEENIGVSIILLNPKGEILLGERKDAYKAGYFGSPGGHVMLTESLTDACIRELMEETDIEIDEKNLEYVGVVRELQDAGSYNFIHFGFVVKDFSGDVKNQEPHKCKEWLWFAQDNLPELILPGHREVINMLSSRSSGIRDLV